ncbi:MAG: aminoacetone oxidase family FAD-binding enzyme [Lachnospiraceae bacterium]|nr:aminoacetone oxidase family FAD-binding enzyme [Lachnospiraceae bacterium]MBQ7601307.1 aminoacetone oxidase family FAD-binding enzyme [Lachnospiraceae bacterium]
MKVLVIGGGASGMMAAVTAAEKGADVTLLEKKEQLGKKILVTGNGKCNYGNLLTGPSDYRGHDRALIRSVLKAYPVEKSIDWFESSGMLSMSRREYLYPASQNAATVVTILKRRLKEAGVEVVTDCYVSRISEISEEGTGFTAFTSRGEFTADKLILACGSEAGVTDERAFNAYGFLTSFGHYVYPALPALVPLFSDSGLESIWDGVRVIAAVTYRENREEGEIQLTKKGISGIPVFQLSRYIAEDLRLRPAFVTIDFLPNYEEEALIGYLTELKGTKRAEQDGYEVLTGWLPKKLAEAFSRQDSTFLRKKTGDYSEADARKLVSMVKDFRLRITGTDDLRAAQTITGGADTTEFSAQLESLLVPGLYVTGELLDVDGRCGGYNLHFAFATGYIAGMSAAG